MAAITLERCEQTAKVYSRYNELLSEREALYTNQKNTGNLPDPTTEVLQKIEKIDKELLPVMNTVFAFEDDLHEMADYELAAIIRWHYLIGLSWTDTNKKVYGKRDYNYSRKKVLRYLKTKTEEAEST